MSDFNPYFFGCFAGTRLRGHKEEAGVSLVEFALVLILLLTIVFGIGGFGHALFTYHFVNEAAKEATRYAAVRGSTCSGDLSCLASNSASGTAGPTTTADVLKYVESITPQSIDSTKVSVTVCGVKNAAKCAASTPTTCTATPNYPGCTAEVQVQYSYKFILPFITTSPVSMSSTSDMVIVH